MTVVSETQPPTLGQRSLDHYVIQVRDLEAAGRAYQRLGFHVLPLARHIEIGSANHIVQLGHTYLELVGMLDQAIPALANRILPRFDCGDGLSIVSLDSSDLETDRKRMTAQQLDPAPIISARRRVRMPQGHEDETDSDCFYIWRAQRTFLSLFLSHHRKPQVIWVPEYQQHPNTALETVNLTYVSDDPAKDLEYFSRVFGCGPEVQEAGFLSFRGQRGETIDIYSKDRLTERYGASTPAVCNRLPGYGVGIRLSVGSMETCAAVLQANNVNFTRLNDTVVVGAEETHGVVIEFANH